MMKGFVLPCVAALLLSAHGLVPVAAQQPLSPLITSFQTYQSMKASTPYNLDWISLGPTLNSARADVVQLDPAHPGTMYVGFGSGSLWKTINNGVSWAPVFEQQSSFSIGDVELAPSNPNIIYIGTGENLKKPRNFTLPGTGMFRSDDAGKTWKHIGLEDSWSIAEIDIHPTNPDIVLVAVLGHLWSKNKYRGLFRTENGGKSWEQVLYLDDATGANDVVIAPSNPDVMYASTWEVYPGINGKNSGVHRSTDGGKTWMACKAGLPSGTMVGRIGLAVSSYNSDKAYALVDNRGNDNDHSAELYKTIDGGLTWSKTHEGPFKIFLGIGWYFTSVYLNPKDDDEVFCLGIRLAHSTDGGKSFSFLGGQVTRMNASIAKGLHLDQCELWINPQNPRHIAVGNDGGLYVSYDTGSSWVHYNNIPTGEFYDITIDHKNNIIYGGTQDDATVFGPPKELNPRFPDVWKYLWIDPWDGGDGCVSQIDPEDNGIVYYSMQHGDAMRLDTRKDAATSIRPQLPEHMKDTLVFNYITPYFISKFDSKTLYHAGNYVMKSIDRGDTWKVISPDLTISSTREKKSFAAGALAESALDRGTLYAGTDRGAFWYSGNDGTSWEEHSFGLANGYIRSICPSRFLKGRVYLAMTGLNYDDLHHYVYVSEDHGKHWKSIATGLPDEPVNVILEDPAQENILYAGGFRGVYVSTDRGEHWSFLGRNMPGAAVADLEIHEPTMDLIAATHGRGIYKINLRPLQTMVAEHWPENKSRLFTITGVKRPWYSATDGDPDYSTVEKASFTYWLPKSGAVTLSVTDKDSKEMWSSVLDGYKGLNEYRWDLVTSRESSDFPYFVHYDKFLPAGHYSVRLSTAGMTLEQPFIVSNGTSPNLK